MKMHYWAVRPVSTRDTGANTRIERAATAREACNAAFGRVILQGTFEAKDLGTRVSVIRSDAKRISLLRDPENWLPV